MKRYGTDQVVGRTLSVISKGVTRDFKITGVIKDVGVRQVGYTGLMLPVLDDDR